MAEEQRKVAIPVTVDGTAAKQGFDQIKADARDMAQAVGQAGQQAGTAMDSGMAAAVKRATAATQEAAQSAMTWSQFLKQNMGPAMKEAMAQGASHAEAHTQAIRKIAAAWHQYKDTVSAAGPTVAAATAQVAQSTAAAAGATAQLTASQSRLMAELQRTSVVATQGRSAWLEHRAALLGVSEAAAPYIARLRQAEQGQSSLHKSVKETTFALRQVPMQMTDIVTSLASGQRPLQVLLQQGGQLKDLFGGIGPAARAMGGYILGLINPFTLAAGAIGVIAYAAHQGSAELRGFQNAATLSGNAIGLSANQYALLRDNIAAIAGTKGKAAEALTEIARSGMFAGDNIKGIAEAAVLMEKATGQAISKTVDQFKRLAEDPAKAAADLNKETHFLTAAIYEQIKVLDDQGKKSEAAAVAMRAYADATAGAARTVVQNAGYLETAWRGVGAAAKWSWDQMLGIGRAATGSEQLESLRKRAAMLEGRGVSVPSSGPTTYAEADLDRTRKQIALLERLNAQVDANAKAEGERARVNAEAQAAIDAVMKANERGLSKQQQMNKALEEYRANIARIRAANPESALLDPAKIAAAERAIREQFKETARKSAADPFAGARDFAKEYADAFRDFAKIQADAQAKTEDLSKAQARLVEYLSSPAYQQHSEQMRQIVLQQAYAAIGAEQFGKAQAEVEKAIKDSAKAFEDFQKGARASEAAAEGGIQKRLADLQAEAQNYGLLESQIARVTLARLEDARNAAALGGENVEYIERQIEAQQRLITALEGKELREANKKAADASAKEWDRVADALTDNIMRGGKNAAQYLKDLFRTLVLRPIISPVGQAVGMMLGGTGAGAAAQAGAGGLSSIGSLGSIASAVSGFGGFAATGFMNTIAGGAGLFGNIGSGLSAGMALMEGGAIMNGLGMIAGTLGPIAIGIAAIMSFVKDRGGPKADGRAGLTYSGIGDFDNSLRAGAEPVLAGLQIQYDQLARAFGAEAAIQFGVAFSTDPKGTSPTFLEIAGSRDGKGVFSDTNLNVGRSDEELKAALEAATTDALLKALRASNLDQPFADFFAGVAADASKQAKEAAIKTATEVASYSGSIRDLGGVFEQLTLQSVAARGALIEAAGGLQALTQSTAAYYENFYSQEEKRQITATQIARTLGQAGVDVSVEDVLAATRAQFRGLVDSLDVTTDAGRKAFAAMMSVSGAFASITEVVQTLGEDVESVEDVLERLRGKLDAVVASFLTPQELVGYQVGQIKRRLAEGGLDVTADQILSASKQEVRELYEHLIDIGNLKAAEAVLDVAEAFLELKDTATEVVASLASEQIQADLEAAADMLRRARASEVDAIKATILGLDSASDRYRMFASDVRRFRDSLLLGELSPLTPEQKYVESRRIAVETYNRALTGDQTAMGQLESVARDFLAASQVYNASGPQYLSDFAAVQTYLELGAVKADEAAAWAEAQSVIMKAQLSSLESIDAGVVSVAAALAQLAQAVGAALAAGMNPGATNLSALTGGVTGQFVGTPVGEVYASAAGAAATGGRIYTANGASYGMDEAREYLMGLYNAGQYSEGYYTLKSAGVSLADGDKLMGWAPDTIERWARENGYPVFHEGTDYVRETGPAIVEQGEAIIPRGQTWQANDLLRELIAKVDALRQAQIDGAKMLRDAQYDAAAQAADKVVDGTANAASRAGWTRELKPQLA